ncbi:hypothetical protein WME95_18285 [Sorangium sp. So ce327]
MTTRIGVARTTPRPPVSVPISTCVTRMSPGGSDTVLRWMSGVIR